MYQTIRYEKNGNIGIATINRPEALNALNSTVISELEQLISEVEKDAELGAFIITGEGRSFVAGADIGEQSTMDVAAGRKWGQRGSALFRRIEKLEIPTIAAVNGFALGGGCELAMSCDIILAAGPNAEGKGGAKFGQPEVGLGITPGFSGTQRLPRRVGVAKAKELIFSGKQIGAEEAKRIGLVNEVYAAEELLNKAVEMAKSFTANAPHRCEVFQGLHRPRDADGHRQRHRPGERAVRHVLCHRGPEGGHGRLPGEAQGEALPEQVSADRQEAVHFITYKEGSQA